MTSTTLRRGMRSSDVLELQEQLKELGFYRHRVDGVFGRGTEASLKAAQRALFVTGFVDARTAEALQAAIEAHETDGQRVLVAGPVPRGLDEIKARFGDFAFEPILDEDGRATGWVDPDPKWAEANIVSIMLPIVGRREVHRLAAPAFIAVFGDIAAKGFGHEIDSFYTYASRHKMHDPRRGLSTHTWGIAGDVNQRTNLPGRVGDLHPEIVASFEKFGFDWGGRWSYRDDMHFQLATGY